MSSQGPTVQFYFPWIMVRISSGEQNRSTLRIKDATIIAGHFYREDNYDDDITPDEVSKMVCKPGEKIYICACGEDRIERHGVQGSFTLADERGSAIRVFAWKNTPVGIDEWSVTGENAAWDVACHSDIRPGQPIGYVTVEVNELL